MLLFRSLIKLSMLALTSLPAVANFAVTDNQGLSVLLKAHTTTVDVQRKPKPDVSPSVNEHISTTAVTLSSSADRIPTHIATPTSTPIASGVLTPNSVNSVHTTNTSMAPTSASQAEKPSVKPNHGSNSAAEQNVLVTKPDTSTTRAPRVSTLDQGNYTSETTNHENVEGSTSIIVIPTDRTTDQQSIEPLEVRLKPSKSSYEVNETIKFQVKGNKQFYLYLFNIDLQTGQGVALLPNRLQTKQAILYPGDEQWHNVLKSGIRFYSDKHGDERIIMVASERYLDIDNLINGSKAELTGDFYLMGQPLAGLYEVINAAFTVHSSTEKTLQVRQNHEGRATALTSSKSLPSGIDIKEFNLHIE